MSSERRSSLIEKAAQKLSGNRQMSLVEKAVAKMAEAEPATVSEADDGQVVEQPVETVARAAKPAQPAAPASPGAKSAAPAKAKPVDVKPAAAKPTPASPVPATPASVEAKNLSPEAAEPAAAATDDDPSVYSIDLVKLQLAGFVTPNSERNRLVEEFRIIKRPLLNMAFAQGDNAIRNGNLIMVTSAGPNDGKTFTAINLAMSMASEQDIKVLLVDADGTPRKAHDSAMGVLGVKGSAGLLDVLNNSEMDLADVLIRTNVKNLTLLPAGNAMINPTELFASNRMGDITEQLARRYSDRLIVIDTPPVLATSEPGVLAMHVGQIVFVVEAERTSRRAVETSLGMISACQHINLMLNKARAEPSSDRFGSYSYY